MSDSEVSKVLSDMTPSLRQCYKQISGLLSTVSSDNIMARYQTGQVIEQVMDSDDREKYGSRAAEQLAAALDMPKQELYRCKVFSQAYTEKQVKTLAARKTSSGRHITWSHIDALIRVPKPELRNALLERVFKEDLRVKRLNELIQKKLGKRGAGKGRPKLAPKTPEGALALLERHAKATIDLWELTQPVVQQLLDSPADFKTDELAGVIDDTVAALDAAEVSFADMSDRLSKAKETLANVGKLKKAVNKPAAAQPPRKPLSLKKAKKPLKLGA